MSLLGDDNRGVRYAKAFPPARMHTVRTRRSAASDADGFAALVDTNNRLIELGRTPMALILRIYALHHAIDQDTAFPLRGLRMRELVTIASDTDKYYVCSFFTYDPVPRYKSKIVIADRPFFMAIVNSIQTYQGHVLRHWSCNSYVGPVDRTVADELLRMWNRNKVQQRRFTAATEFADKHKVGHRILMPHLMSALPVPLLSIPEPVC